MAKLTEKMKRFCEEYVIDLNATQAAIRAGYSKATAPTIASQNLQKLNVKAYIKELREEQQATSGITADRVLREYGRIAFLKITDLYAPDGRMLQPHELPEDVAAAVSSFKSRSEISADGSAMAMIDEYKHHDKMKALDMLSRHLGLDVKGGGDGGGSGNNDIVGYGVKVIEN